MVRRFSGEVEVGFEAVATAFATEAAFLVATEGGGGVELVVGVCPEHAGSDAFGDVEGLGAFVGPDAAGETVGSVVGDLDCFVGGPEGLNGEDWAEDFLLDDAVRLCGA